MQHNLRFAVVGTGWIAGVVATAIMQSTKATLTAVSSRKLESARAFVAQRSDVAAVQGVSALLARDDVDAVYIATPTTAKEVIALAAIAAGKHVLVDKPFVDLASVQRMSEAAAKKGVLFMDATHFVHHPRTAAIRDTLSTSIGIPKSLNTTFYFPFNDRSNIRFDQASEPTGAVGDMAWYAMRAIVEYLQPQGVLSKIAVVSERDTQTGTVIRLAGLLGFASGETSTFDVGYTAGTVVMDLSLLGTTGMIAVDDFVLDWGNSAAFQNTDIQIGYTRRSGQASRKDFHFIETRSDAAAVVLMIDRFVELTNVKDGSMAVASVEATRQTQGYLDAIWQAMQS